MARQAPFSEQPPAVPILFPMDPPPSSPPPVSPSTSQPEKTLIVCETMQELQQFVTLQQITDILVTTLQRPFNYDKHLLDLGDGHGRILWLKFLDPAPAPAPVPRDYVDNEIRRWILVNWLYDSDEHQPPAQPPAQLPAPHEVPVPASPTPSASSV